MTNSMRRRSFAALLAAVGCLLLLATPAAASTTTTTLYVHAGTLDVSIDADEPYEVVVEVGGDDHTCTADPAPVSHFVVHDNLTTGMVDLLAVTLGEAKEDGYYATFFDFGGNEYQLETRLGNPGEIGFGTNTGVITGTHPNQTVSQHALLEGLIYQTSGCEKVGGPICHFAIELTITGAYNHTTMMIGPFSGTGTPAVDFCNSPFAGLADGRADITGLTLDDELPPA